MGTGTGHESFTRDVPVPVLAGDGSVTGSHHIKVTRQYFRATTSTTPAQRTAATTRHEGYR